MQRDANVTKRNKKSSSISLNLPAAGLGNRPPSVVSSVADEGGFNEPSPEIKAKLKPAYPSFDGENGFDDDEVQLPAELDETITVETIVQNGSASADKAEILNYVDVGYRRTSIEPPPIPDDIYVKSDVYPTNCINNSVLDELEQEEQKLLLKNRKIAQHIYNSNSNSMDNSQADETVVYAIIKPEIPSASELMLEVEKDEAIILDREDKNEIEKGYHSPQTILDPTRITLTENDDVLSKPLPDLPINRPTKLIPDSPLDIQDVEYADASDNEEEHSLPDAMTADEADRLLSSRYVLFILFALSFNWIMILTCVVYCYDNRFKFCNIFISSTKDIKHESFC